MVRACWRTSSSVGAISAACAAGFDHRGRGKQGDDRLAGSDVALEETEHPLRAGEIMLDFGQGLRLAAGQFEGQGAR